jgi:WD40 repeat protein
MLHFRKGTLGFTGVAFSPDGRWLAASHASGRVWIWDTATGTEMRELRGHLDPANAVAFSPDGQRLATAGDDQTVRLWDAVTGTELLTLTLGPPGASLWATSVTFSPDGQRLAVGGSDRKVRIWEGASSRR